MVRAATPTPGTAPVTGRCTRYVALHPLRGAAPDQNGCIAYGSGAPPTPTSPNADTHTSPGAGSAPPTTATHYLDRHCATYSPAQRPPSSATLPLTNPTAARVATTQGTTSTTGHCTRYVALHLLRSAAPVQNGCIAYRSGAPPTPTSPNADTHTSPRTGSAPPTTATHQLDRHCASYSPAQRPHLAQHSHSQAQPRRALQPHRALHPLCGAAPLTWRCTRSERVHCLHIGCIDYGSGAPPTPTSPNADMHTSPGTGSAPPTTATHYLDRYCATYSPAQCSASSATLPLTSPTAACVATTQGTTSTTGRCTRYVALHLLRSAAPLT